MKKIFTSLALASVLVSGSLYAHNSDAKKEGQSCGVKKEKSSCDTRSNKQSCDTNSNRQSCDTSSNKQSCGTNNNKCGKDSSKGGSIFAALCKLDLSSEQKEQMKAIFKESKKSSVSISDAFTKDSFDKAKFNKIMKEKVEESKTKTADLIEKIYKILNKKQKEELKAILDSKK